MQHNRRTWIRNIGLASAATLFGTYNKIEAKPLHWYPPRPILDGEPIRLSANENPFGPSPLVRKSIQEAFDVACRYPSASRDGLLEAIAQKEGLTKDHIVITGGSTEGLKMCGLAYGLHTGEIIAADPTFKALTSYAEHFGAHIHRVPLDANLQHDLNAMEGRINNRTSLIFICNPNNPTGTLLPADDYRAFCEQASKKAIVFADEAYGEFIDDPNYPSMLELVKQGKNVVVSRTFSKVYGLAGMRIGYLIARPDIASRLIKHRMAYTNVLALHAAKTALAEEDFYQYSITKNQEAKAIIYQTLDELGLDYQKSQTNFVFFKTGKSIEHFIPMMLKEGVRVGRPFPPLVDWCRISTGTIKEMEILSSGLKKVLV